eukprot:TRINITY_DN67722_c1_g11_i2.p1 TRINITY_DN67722_c1_g11~~TRINITY_DN67722_c1_g11_i2.p1  ORF type:complete len:713 (+),score=49.85 TRINITY_DN67722_c1_g11_i2:83-2221(+)
MGHGTALGIALNTFVSFRYESPSAEGGFLSAKTGGHVGLSRTLAENETFLLRPVSQDPGNMFVVVKIYTFWHKTCLAAIPPDQKTKAVGGSAAQYQQYIHGPTPIIHADPDAAEHSKRSSKTYGQNPMFLWEIRKHEATTCWTIRPYQHRDYYLSGHNGHIKLHPDLGIFWSVPVCKRFTYNQGILVPRHPPEEYIGKLVYLMTCQNRPQLVTASPDAHLRLVNQEADNETFVISKEAGVGRVSIKSTRWKTLLVAQQDGSVVHLPPPDTEKRKWSSIAALQRWSEDDDDEEPEVDPGAPYTQIQTIFTSLYDERAQTYIFSTCYGTRLTFSPSTGAITSTASPIDRAQNWRMQSCSRNSSKEITMLLNKETSLLHAEKRPLQTSSSLIHDVFAPEERNRRGQQQSESSPPSPTSASNSTTGMPAAWKNRAASAPGERWTVGQSNLYKSKMRDLMGMVDTQRRQARQRAAQRMDTDKELKNRAEIYKAKVQKYADAKHNSLPSPIAGSSEWTVIPISPPNNDDCISDLFNTLSSPTPADKKINPAQTHSTPNMSRGTSGNLEADTSMSRPVSPTTTSFLTSRPVSPNSASDFLEVDDTRPMSAATEISHASSVGESVSTSFQTDNPVNRPQTPADEGVPKCLSVSSLDPEEWELRRLEDKYKQHKQKLYSVDFSVLSKQKQHATNRTTAIRQGSAGPVWRATRTNPATLPAI